MLVDTLIAPGTLVEKIQELQQKKAALANAVLDPAAGLEKGLAAEDIKAIFSIAAS